LTTSLSATEIRVGLNFTGDILPVGRLALHERRIYFEYDTGFIGSGLEISPLHLPLQSGLMRFQSDLFDGLPGVFNDSLPDGWGRLLFDRLLRSRGFLPDDVTPLDRLAHAGSHAQGALVYEPDLSVEGKEGEIILDILAAQARDVLEGALEGAADDVLAELEELNGSSAGARPKALIGVDKTRQHLLYGVHDLPDEYKPWIVKFPNSQDGPDAGAIEYVYALMAREAGLGMPEFHLFGAEGSAGYFATRRFDREGKRRNHMHSAGGLLHSDIRTPSLDYEDLIALTFRLSCDMRQVEKMVRLAVFNVLAHNRDDHARNFSFLMDAGGDWTLSPAYDLTFSSGPGGEQSTMVMGEGKTPGTEHLIRLAEAAGLKRGVATEIIDMTRSSLARWPNLAGQHGVREANIKLIGDIIG
jgi:serine/threonine-protein kinase HipA